MEIVHGAELQLQHSEKKEVEQNHKHSGDSSEPSGDSSNPSNDSSEPSSGSNKPSYDETEPSSDRGRPSGDNTKPLNDSSSQPTSEISESQLSESEYSSIESGKREQIKHKPLNLERSENISNIEEQSINKIPDHLYPDIRNDLNQQFASSDKGDNGCGGLAKDNISSCKLTCEASCDVSKPALQTSIEGGKVVGTSDPSFISGSTDNRLNSPRNSSKCLFPMLPDSEANTSQVDQDLTEGTLLNQVDYNSNYFTSQVDYSNTFTSQVDYSNTFTSQVDHSNTFTSQVDYSNTFTSQVDYSNTFTSQVDYRNSSSLRKRTHNPVSEPKLLVSESAQLEPGRFSRIIGMLFFVLFVVLLAGGIFQIKSSSTSISDSSPVDRFSTNVHKMKQSFPNQNHQFWKTLEVSTNRILKNDASRYPAVILMASSLKNASVTLCLARNISSAFDSSVGLSPNSPLIDFRDYKNLTADEQKFMLDSALNSALETDKRRSLVLENLQLLDPFAAVLFYSYCDNDYAPFKDVLILLTLYFDDEKEKIDDTKAVENYLEVIWSKGLITDIVKPLLSRVANHIVIVQGESPETLNNHCL